MYGKQSNIYIIRHGQTNWNVAKIIQGQSDKSCLTQLGKRQAQRIAGEFKDILIQAIFSSDLTRAKMTADIIASGRKLVVSTSTLLRERKWGSYEGKEAKLFRQENQELISQYEKLSDKDRWEFKFAPDIESRSEVCSRFVTFLKEVAVIYTDKMILIVTHGGVMRIFLQYVGWTKKELSTGAINNTGYIKLLSTGSHFLIGETKGINAYYQTTEWNLESQQGLD